MMKYKQSGSVIGCLVIGIILVLLSCILIVSAFTWFPPVHSLYDLSESVIAAMLGCASLIIGAIFIIVGIILNRVEKRSK